MCPGGEVINASSENEKLVVNGMSYSSRSSAFSNSAIVVTCNTDDYKSENPLAGIEFQRQIEKNAFNTSGGKWKVPAQNLLDFLCGKLSNNLNLNSYKMGAVSAEIQAFFPKFITDELFNAFNNWKEDYPLFISEHGILLGAETRVSAPVKINRTEKYESVNIKNLYPIGEGSGYAGGIVSSAVDAVKAVEKSLAAI